jgi:sec-independent protein translocase protein TatA
MLVGTVQGPELFIILVIVLLVFGSKKLPELARSLGEARREFEKASEEQTSTRDHSEEMVEEGA